VTSSSWRRGIQTNHRVLVVVMEKFILGLEKGKKDSTCEELVMRSVTPSINYISK